MKNPFRYFNSSPEVIRLTVMMYVRYPLSLRQVEDLLSERGIDTATRNLSSGRVAGEFLPVGLNVQPHDIFWSTQLRARGEERGGTRRHRQSEGIGKSPTADEPDQETS